MSVIEGGIKKAGVAAAAVLLSGVTAGAGSYIAVKAASGALDEAAKKHTPFKSQQTDVGDGLNTTA